MYRFCLAAAWIMVLGATSTGAAEWTMGAKAGVNLAEISGDIDGETSLHTGGQGGAFVQAGFNDRWAGRLEMLYVAKGVKVENAGTTIDVMNGYIEFPLLAVFEFWTDGMVTPSLFAGPTFGFNISENIEFGESSSDDGAIEGFELGATFGAGLEIPAGRLSIVMDGRYSLGLSDVSDTLLPGDETARNRGMGIMAGIAFPITSQE